MRVVAGTLGGRRFEAPSGSSTRPTSDRVREAIFSALHGAGAIEGASVLDAFAGSGALGFEALSRGAACVTFVERSRSALAVLKSNTSLLGVETSATVVAGDVFRLVRRGLPRAPFSLLFLDPPYKLDQSEVRGLIESLLESGALAPGAFVVWEHASGYRPELPPGFVTVREKRYGDTTVITAVNEGAGEVS